MKNKTLMIVILLLIILVLAILVVCNKDKIIPTSATKSTTEESQKSFSIKFNGIDVTPGEKFEENKISEEANLSEIPSCAFDGVDKVYTYSNVEITVADVDKVPTVYSVYFINENISTDEGIKISDTKDLMIEKYGKNYDNSLSNVYEYTKGNVILSFIVENDIITGIEYTLLTNN